MMPKFLQVLMVIFLPASSFCQMKISGRVIDESQSPVIQASIEIKGKTKISNTVSQHAGYFGSDSLPAGVYLVSVTAIGYEHHAETVVLANKSAELRIVLTPVRTELQLVEIIGRSARKYNSDYSFGATRIATANKYIPQSIASMTKELIADRQAFQLADVVKIASGVIPSSYYNQYAIRGISQNEEGQVLNGMRTRQNYFLQPITNNIERVEVIKGAASATFSSVDPGGTINMVTKKPLDVARREISMSVGSFSTIRGTLDFTGPLNEGKTLLYRLNGAYQEARSFRDLVNNKSLLISPSISYVPNSKTAINAEMIFSNLSGHLDRGQPIFGAVAGVTNLKSTPISLNLGAPNDYFRSKEFIITGTLSHKFNSWLSFNNSYMKQTWTEDLQEHRTTGAFAVDTSNTPVTSFAAMQFVQRKQVWSVDNVNTYFAFDLNTGAINHKLLVGYDLHSWQKMKGGGQNSARGFLLNNGSATNTFNKNNVSGYQTINVDDRILPRPNVNHFDLNNPAYTIRNVDDYTINARTAIPSALTTTNAVYIQEQLKWWRVLLLLSLRYDRFEDITNYKAPREGSFVNERLLPRVGLTYEVTRNVNAYITYLEGFQPQSNTVTLLPATGSFFWTDASAALFKPLISNLKEAGVKAEFSQKKISLNMAVYEINQKNILISANDPSQPDLLVQRGADRSRGFEMGIAGFITPGWQINASYSYIDAKIMMDANKALVGARKENVPKQSANLWTRYNFPKNSLLDDLGVGFGVQYQGSKIPWFTRAFEVPSFVLFDAAIYYSPAKTNLQVAVNAGNLLNTTYWIGAQNYLRLFPGAPRNGTLTVTYKF
jgi:iron complex outermembrane receptor protein